LSEQALGNPGLILKIFFPPSAPEDWVKIDTGLKNPVFMRADEVFE